MLAFFKEKPRLKDLLGGNFIDIHSHLLPGIDDGAKTIADTLRLAKAFEGIGVEQWITTPHSNHYLWNNSREKIVAQQAQTIALLAQQHYTSPFGVAAEYFMNEAFDSSIECQNLLTLKDKYVLVEMSYINAPIQLYTLLFNLQTAGYIPVLAHPERYLYYHKNTKEYLKLKKVGCLFQLNLLAVVGYYGPEVTQTANLLLENGSYDFAGTDVHHDQHIAAFDQKIKIKAVDALKATIANNQFFRKEY